MPEPARNPPLPPRAWRWLWWLLPALVLPAIPFLLLGESFETRVVAWLDSGFSPSRAALVIGGLLASDLFLPIPSTAVCALAGATLGWSGGVAVVWCGLTAGGLIGYLLARGLGRSFAERFANPADLESLDVFMRRYGLYALLVSRALPLLAEAVVLIAGTAKFPFRLFLCGLLVSNLAIAVAYVSVGVWFRDSPALPVAIVGAAVVPLLFAWALRNRWRTLAERGD